MPIDQIQQFEHNQQVLCHYAELKRHETPSYHAMLEISTQGDFYIQESGGGIAHAYYFVKNFFKKLCAEGIRYFFSPAPIPSPLSLVSRVIHCIETQYQAALNEVEEYYLQLSYCEKSDGEIRREKGEQFLVAHLQWRQHEKPYFNVINRWFHQAFTRLERTQVSARLAAIALPNSFPTDLHDFEMAKKAGERLACRAYAVGCIDQVFDLHRNSAGDKPTEYTEYSFAQKLRDSIHFNRHCQYV